MDATIPVVAIVGLCGAGKTEVANRFVQRRFTSVHFGQITFEELTRRNLPVTEANERLIREGFRAEHGMAAFALLNIPKIDALLAQGKQVLIDGLYSWSEYKLLKEKYSQALTIVAVYAPPELRYTRLNIRQQTHGSTEKMYRSLTKEEAQSRDYAEIENIEKAGPIAMAEYTIVNTGSLTDLDAAVAEVEKTISK